MELRESGKYDRIEKQAVDAVYEDDADAVDLRETPLLEEEDGFYSMPEIMSSRLTHGINTIEELSDWRFR